MAQNHFLFFKMDWKETLKKANEEYKRKERELSQLPKCRCGNQVKEDGQTCDYCLFKAKTRAERIAESYLTNLYC